MAEIELMALDMTVMRVLSAKGKAPGPEASTTPAASRPMPVGMV